MADELIIPADVGDHCRRVADYLDRACFDLDCALRLWAHPDDDDWYVQLEHVDAEQMRKNLGEIAKFADFLAKHGGA